MRKRLRLGRWGLGVLLCLSLAQAGPSETADCILALVNDDPVTLSDILILDAFGIGPSRASSPRPERRRAVLEDMIGLKVVILMARGSIVVPQDRVEAALSELRGRWPAGEFESRLAAFGLSPEDLKSYLEERVIFQEIIDRRFSPSVAVTLAEIETYYEETYIPGQKGKGLPATPMLQILAELEASVKNEKIRAQVESWVLSLRGQADVVLKDECLKLLKEERS